MGAELLDDFVKYLPVFLGVNFGELSDGFTKLLVHPGMARHSVAAFNGEFKQ